MLVEDDSGSRKLMSIVLGRAGYEVIPAGNSAEALETIREEAEPFDLVIMDLELPGLSGFGAAGVEGWRNKNSL